MIDKHKISLRQTISILFRAFKVSIRTKSRLSLFLSILGFGMAFLPSLTANILRDFTNSMQSLFEKKTSLGISIILFVTLVSLFVMQNIFNYIKNYFLRVDSIRTDKYIKETILNYTCDIEYKYIENYDGFREKIAFINGAAGQSVANSIQSIFILLQNIIVFVSVAFLLAKVNIFIVLFLILTTIPSAILSYLQKDEEYKNKTKWMKEGQMVVHYFMICVKEASMKEIRHFGILNYLKEKWKQFSQVYFTKKNEMTKKHVLYNSIADILRNGVYICVLLLAAYEIYQKPQLGIGVFMLVFNLTGQMQNSTIQTFTTIVKIFNDIKYMQDFFDISSVANQKNQEQELKAYGRADIHFKNVSFQYPGNSYYSLKRINLTINDGESIAIVGENGSGKTTFVKLLCGLYEPSEGAIWINKNDIRCCLTSFRKSISIIFQDYGRYETTLKENIAVADDESLVNDDEILEASKKTGLYEYIIEQNDGLCEEIGVFSKGGKNLSGGQWQKVALTRAIYKKEARIILLDEPTAALDPIAEAHLYRNLISITENRTTILVSHRLGITKLVDRILVFKDGEIIEDGNHSELLKNNGYYADLYQTQAKWYSELDEVTG